MRIIGIGVCGPNEKYLDENLEQRAQLCDDVIIVGNNIDEKSERKIRAKGFWFYRDDREWGKYQPLIKTDLLKKAGKLKPDWILACDMDELYDSRFDRKAAEDLANKGGIGWYFYIVNFWNDKQHYRKEMNFWNIRFYRYAPEYGLEFQKKNLHCGLGPPITYHYGNYAPYLLKHYGLMDQEARERKVERYNKFDPNAIYKDKSYYDSLKDRHTGTVFNEAELQARVAHEVSTYKIKEVNMTQQQQKFVYARRKKDGKVLDMPYDNYLRVKDNFDLIEEVAITRVEKDVRVAPPEIVEDSLECPVCGVIAKSEKALQTHKTKKHGKVE